MDKLSLIGLLLALAALIGGSILKGAGLSGLWSPAAFVIVIVGTIAATMVQTRLAVAKRAFQIAKWLINPPSRDREELARHFVELATKARRGGVLVLESEASSTQDSFIRKGLQMVVDGSTPETIRAALELDIHVQHEKDMAAAKMFENAGVYSPTLGIIGAVLGLMAVMKNLSDPSKIGHGIAAAFTATIYGIGIANLLLLPMAGKIKSHIANQVVDREMMIEAFAAISAGINPREVESRLSAFLS